MYQLNSEETMMIGGGTDGGKNASAPSFANHQAYNGNTSGFNLGSAPSVSSATCNAAYNAVGGYMGSVVGAVAGPAAGAAVAAAMGALGNLSCGK